MYQRLQRNLLLEPAVDSRRPPLLRAKDIADFKVPVYVLVAEDEVFFS
jgi:hypothetical protein